MALARGTVSTTPVAVYTSVGTTAITNVYFCNTSSTVVTIDIHLASDGTMGDATNVIYKGISIPAYDTFVMDTEKIVLDEGDALYASASASPAIVVTVSYMRIK